MTHALGLQDIEGLGGTEEDLRLLEGVDEESASELEFDDSGQDQVSHKEIQDFISSIGMRPATKLPNTPSTKMLISKSKIKKGERGKTSQQTQGEVEEVKRKRKTKHKTAPVSNGITSMEDGECLSSQEEKQPSSKVKPGVPRSLDASDNIEEQLLSFSPKNYKGLLVRLSNGEAWFVQMHRNPLIKSAGKEPAFPVSTAVLEHVAQVGAELMRTEVEVYEKVREKMKGPSDVRWLRTVLSSGTLRDKVAARTLIIQESPVHTLSFIDAILSMASKKGKRESILAVDTLKELWASDLLPEERKLKSLKQRPLNLLVANGHSARVRHHMLLLWYYEDQLKNKYAQFISILQGLSFDTVVHIREKMVGHIFDLLYQKPEQEQSLLSQLVNKLGDPVRRVASKAMLLLLKLLNHHVNMKLVVMRQLESLLHRPNISQKAQYYGVCCLNQFILGPNDDNLATKLMYIYFTFFKVYVQHGQLDGKMLGALLTGVNRAFPFVKGDIPAFEDHLHSLFKVVYVGPLATGIQALMFLFQVMESRQAVSGRFYQALYAKLMDPALKHSSKQAVFLNVLFKSLKSDPVINRVKAFLKRILQVCAYHAPPFVCGCLYLISEILKLKPALWSFILQPELTDEEHFEDVLEDDDDTILPPPPGSKEPSRDCVGVEKKSGMDVVTGESAQLGRKQQYWVGHRNPLYCGAERSCLWELASLSCHYHPSVQVFARKIATSCSQARASGDEANMEDNNGNNIDYNSDPLEDFTLIRFLDRFVCKNPKQKQSDHGGSLMQRASKLTADPKRDVPVTSTQFAALDESKVRDDELFVHRYFSQKAAGESKQKKEEREKERDSNENVDELEFNPSERDVAEMNFARDLEVSQLERQVKARNRSKKRRRESDSSESEKDLESDEEFDYDAMDAEGFEEDAMSETGGMLTEAEMEQMLLDDLSDEGEPEPEEGREPARKRRHRSGFDPSSMFAAADEFAHMLEDSSEKDSANAKQMSWEILKSRSQNTKHHRQRKKNKPKVRGHQNKTHSSRTGSRGKPQNSKKKPKTKKNRR